MAYSGLEIFYKSMYNVLVHIHTVNIYLQIYICKQKSAMQVNTTQVKDLKVNLSEAKYNVMGKCHVGKMTLAFTCHVGKRCHVANVTYGHVTGRNAYEFYHPLKTASPSSVQICTYMCQYIYIYICTIGLRQFKRFVWPAQCMYLHTIDNGAKNVFPEY